MSIFIPTFPNAGIIFRAIHLSVVRRLGCKSSAPSLPNVPSRLELIEPSLPYLITIHLCTRRGRGEGARVVYTSPDRAHIEVRSTIRCPAEMKAAGSESVKQISSHFCRWSMHPNREKNVVVAFVVLSSQERIFYGDEEGMDRIFRRDRLSPVVKGLRTD